MKQHNLRWWTIPFFVACLVASCGKKARVEPAYSSGNMSLFMLEKECSRGEMSASSFMREIGQLFSEYQQKHPLAFISIPPKSYSYKAPLSISRESLERELEAVKKNMDDESKVNEVATEINDLYYKASRYESLTCALPSLSFNKRRDVIPYLELADFCQQKNGDEYCTQETLDVLEANDKRFVQERALSLCQVFSTDELCRTEYRIKRKKHQELEVIHAYQKKFKLKIFEGFFRLKEEHLKFQCQRSPEGGVLMKIKMARGQWENEVLKPLTEHLSTVWSREDFKLEIELVDEESGSNVIQIVPTDEAISYVHSSKNNRIHLSQSIDPKVQKEVLAHEFGHVLGFPDCYVEFFDKKNRDLIYYELSEKNLMCSLKEGGSIPEGYFSQLVQNSCFFN